MRKTIAILAGIILCAALLVGCTQAVVNSIDTQQQDEIMTEVFNALENADVETLAQYTSRYYMSEDDIIQMAESGSAYIEGTVSDFKKTDWYLNRSLNNGVESTTLDLAYDVVTGYDSYVVSMRLLQTGADSWEVAGLNVIRAEELKGNGAIINFESFDVLQLLMLLVSVGELALIIVAIVACVKSRVRSKALWIVMILLLHTGVSLTLSSAGFDFNIWLLNLNLTSLQKFIDGTRIYNVLVPLGAILFLSLKKKLEWRAERRRMMQQYRQDYVPPYTPSEEPPEEVMRDMAQTPDPEPPDKSE